MNDPADAGRNHADLVREHTATVRRVTEAALAFPDLAAADRSELQKVLLDADRDERIFVPEPTPEALKLFVERMDALLERVHTIASNYAKQAS